MFRNRKPPSKNSGFDDFSNILELNFKKKLLHMKNINASSVLIWMSVLAIIAIATVGFTFITKSEGIQLPLIISSITSSVILFMLIIFFRVTLVKDFTNVADNLEQISLSEGKIPNLGFKENSSLLKAITAFVDKTIEAEKQKLQSGQLKSQQDFFKDFTEESKKKEQEIYTLKQSLSQLEKTKAELDSSLQTHQAANEKLTEELQVSKEKLAELEVQLEHNNMEVESVKEQQASISKKEKHLEEISGLVKQTFSIIHHDVTKSLEVIESTVSNDLKEAKVSVKVLNSINSEVQIAKTIINSMNTRTNMFLSGKEIAPEVINISDLVVHLYNDFKYMAEYDDIKLVQDLPTEYYVKGDKELIITLFRNLIMNGIEAIKELKKKGKRMLTITAADTKNSMQIFVKDTGVGIQDTDKGGIFKQPIDSTKGKDRKGVGTELCRQIVERHSGEIQVVENREPDTKTTIKVSLPLAHFSEKNKINQYV